METSKKIELLEDMFEVEAGTLTPDMNLCDIDQWDSMASLSLILLLDEQFGKEINGEDIKKLSTIQDILNMMN